MAFDIKQLALRNSVNGFNEWVYDTTDAHATVDTSGYFTGDAVSMLRVGDVILVRVFTTAAKTTLSTIGNHVVLSNTGSVVNVSDVTAIAVTNTD